MAECQYHCTLEVPNEGNGKEGVGRDVCMSDVVVVLDKRTSFRAGDRELHFKVLALRKRELNLWIWIIKV